MIETAIEVQEKPILFSGAMVRAILDGSKTQTRRVVKPQPSEDWNPEVGVYAPTRVDRHGEEYPGADVFGASDENEGRVFPYGKPGDRLWVRETWQYFGGDEYLYQKNLASVAYKATWDSDKSLWKEGTAEPTTFDYWPEQWRPSIFMPRWASRMTLEITEVRVERVQEISGRDAQAEGAEPSNCVGCSNGECTWNRKYEKPQQLCPMFAEAYIYGFRHLWESINSKRDDGKYAWAKNPWVWAISFKRVQG